MPTVTMPQLGESVAEGTIGKWLKQVGDTVELGEPIVEVVTDKVNAEVPSPFAGTLTEILVEEGQTVPNEANIAVIEAVDSAAAADAEPDAQTPEPAEQAPEPAEQAPEPAVPAWPATPAATLDAPPGPSPAPAANQTPAAATSAIASYTGRMTPAVRRLAREHAVDLAAVPGTGFGGRVTRDDITSHIAAHPATNGSTSTTNGSTSTTNASAPATTPGAPSTPAHPATPGAPSTAGSEANAPTQVPAGPATDYLKPLSQMRKGIAAQMTRAASVPTAYETVEVDMSAVMRLRDRSKRAYTEREGISLSFVAFVTKAAVVALRKQPDLNSHWTEEGHWIRAAINIGVAVAVDDGLMVPVVRDADGFSIHGLNKAINEVAARTRTRKLKASDIGGGTFTVDNTGWTGSILTLPILNVPEVAILTMEAIVKRPVVIESAGGDSIAIRPMMAMVLGFDHRATDGAQAGRFLTDVKRWLEQVDDTTPIW